MNKVTRTFRRGCAACPDPALACGLERGRFSARPFAAAPTAVRWGGASVARSTYRAFTLVEMLVSLAVLSLALAVVGVVFTVTTRTAGQAAAYSEALRWVRQFTEQIREDLRYCDPARSLLVIVGRTQPAALRPEDLAAGKHYRVLIGDPADVPSTYDPELAPNLDQAQVEDAQYSDPRADLLMFFSDRPTLSQAPVSLERAADDFQRAVASGAKLAPIQVVYGHASFGQADSSGTAISPTVRHIENPAGLSPFPAVRWVLARRAVILDANAPANKDTFGNSYPYCGDEWARITTYQPDEALGLSGDTARLDLAAFLRDFETPPGGLRPALFTAYPQNLSTDAYWNAVSSFGLPLAERIRRLLYYYGSTGEAHHHVATVLEDVPVALRGNLGLRILPGCVWFQVEFLMPEDPRNSIEFTGSLTDPNAQSKRTDMPRWTAVYPGRTYIFVPDTETNRSIVRAQINPVTQLPYSNSRLSQFARLDQAETEDSDGDGRPDGVLSQRLVRLWPYALRITVRVYDPRGRLDQPIVRSVVHRFD